MGKSGTTGGGLVVLILLFWAVGVVYFVSSGGGGSAVEMENVSVQVTLYEEDALLDRTSGYECGSYIGPAPGSFEVAVHGFVNETRDEPTDSTYRLTAQIDEYSDSLRFSADDDGRTRFFDLMSFRNNESFDVGDEADLTLSLRRGGRTLDTVSRTVTVEEIDFEERCVE